MINRPISNRAFTLWALLAGLEGMLALFFIAREPSELESVFAFGLSLQRLLIAAGVLIMSLFFVVIAIAHFYQLLSWNASINKKTGMTRCLLLVAFILELIILHLLFFVPDYYFPTVTGYLSRLKPALVWLALIFAQTLFFLAYMRGFTPGNIKSWSVKHPAIVILSTLGITWTIISITGIGIVPDPYYWNVAGVPILAGQVWIASGLTTFAWFLYQRFLTRGGFSQTTSVAVFIVIWIVAAIVWIKTPFAPTFNAPGPYPPSRGFYPFVDAAFFDLGAQSALYGKGLFFRSFIDRPLLSGFLAVLHRVFGQNYIVVITAQSAIFAVFPALLYLLGKKLHSISAGVLVAILATFKVANAIAGGKLISTSHPKLMLTEFPTAIVLVLISLFLVGWLIDRKSNLHNLAGIGASIGVGILLRHNVFFVFPVVLILGLIVWQWQWKRAARDVLFVIVTFFVTISPWMVRSQVVSGEPLFFLEQFNRVIEQRYQPQSHDQQNRFASRTFTYPLRRDTSIVRAKEHNAVFMDEYQFIPKHFVHNIVTSVLILPPSPVLDDLRHVIDQYPYWDRMENASLGDISGSMAVFLAFNLVVLSIGMASSWKRFKYAALAPLLIFLFYNLANAFARTSGGRYIVPTDWVIYFYYAIGLIEIIRFLFQIMGFQTDGFFEKPVASAQGEGNGRQEWVRTGLVILPFFMIVAMLPLIELASPGEHPSATTSSLLDELEEHLFFEKSGIARQDLEQFLENPDAVLITGRGFYPRYYSFEEGESFLPGQNTPYTPRAYPRLVFTLLLPDGDRPVLLPINDPGLRFPDAVEVIAGGCQVGQSTVLTSYFNYINAAFVVIQDETGTVYVRIPEAPLTCPLPEPVCDNNHFCQ